MRLLWLFLILAVLMLVPFVIWGDYFADRFDLQDTNAWLVELGRPWAWAVGIGLLLSDLFLPIPGTIVMSSLGFVYGPWLGGILAVTGSMLSGIVAYGLCRKLGRPGAEWIAGKKDLDRGEALFGGRAGGWMVALSRWLPIMPEVIACIAGMVRMPFRRYLVALGCGSLPLGFTFAAIGQWAQEHPAFALLLSAGFPPLLWVVIGPIVMRRGAASDDDPDG
ncbi:MAG: VTT domain-containing protein [Roseibacillus sp.]|nr:VTT domain-containing protein [Roseibacillus sp.]